MKLVRALLLLAACKTPTPAPPAAPAPPPPPAEAPSPASAQAHPPIHLEGQWLAARATRLGLDEAAAAARDASFAAAPPADGLWWDEPLAREVWGLWTELCMECHDGSRSQKKVLSLPPPPRGWSEEDALFFRKSLAPREVYRSIAEGVKSKRKEDKDMPAWSPRLTHEQIWGLVYFVRSASKPRGGDLR